MGAVTDFYPVHPPLLRSAIETEKHVATAGWDQPIRLFALVDAEAFAAAEPGLPLPSETEQVADGERSYVAVEQEDLPEHTDVEELLGQIGWPPQVDGVAVALERIVLPPGAEEGLPEDPAAASTALLDHPDRADIRLLAAVARDGERTVLVRQRAHDDDDQVATGEEIAPGLLEALAATLLD